MQRCFRSDRSEVAIAFFIFSQHQKMVIGIAVRRSALDPVVVFFADVKLAADNRLYTSSFGRIHKMNCTENIAMISHGNRGHTQLFYAVAKLLYVASAVEHRIISM